MQPWELELFKDTCRFVATTCPQLTPDKYEEVVTKIYATMHRTLKLFEEK